MTDPAPARPGNTAMADPAELEAGVSLARLAELAGVSTSTLRHYEGLGLIQARPRDGRRVYDAAALQALSAVRRLRGEGLKLSEIASRGVDTAQTETEAAVEADPAQVAALRARLEEGRARLAALVRGLEARQAELGATLAEREAAEALREDNRRRAQDLTRRAADLQARVARPRITRLEPPAPGGTTRRRK